MKNLKIGTQLKIVIATMLIFVIAIGIVSYIQSDKIYQQTKLMHDHPFNVKSAISELRIEVLKMRIASRDLILAKNAQEKQEAIQLNEIAIAGALEEFSTLKNQYLGPQIDIEEASKAFNRWKIAQQENVKSILSGDVGHENESELFNSSVIVYYEQMMSIIAKIDDFASNNADFLQKNSQDLSESLNRRLIYLVAIILVISIIINYYLLRSIRKPIYELTNATNKFENGDMNARSKYQSANEFGELSNSFNQMVERIQKNSDLDEKVVSLAGLMLTEYDAKKFFQSTLKALSDHTNSQMAAIYLVSNDKKRFEHFESIGMSDAAKHSFAADVFEGEFGAVLMSKNIQYVKNISEDTRFIFNTVSGKYIPREIITLPIISDNEVVAIISLASVNKFSNQSILLINRILVTLSARVEGIMAFHKMKEFSEKLEIQYRELEAQKTELASQSTELKEQNIELEMQKNQLSEASRLKTNFLSNMSHELRTPLNSVIALSGVLNRRLDHKIPAEEYSYLEVIERNGKHLLSLINDILDISRIEAGYEEIEITKFNANNLVVEISNMILPQAQVKNIELIQNANNMDLYITSDSDKCRHILQNLIGNAVKFTEEGSVEITTNQTGNFLDITVTDSGIGISENHLPHIFDEFRQADGSTSRKFGGTGLGLAIAKKYANILGGTISVKSKIDVGSSFTLTLPLSYVAENKLVVEERTYINHIISSPSRNNGLVKTILLVEDSEPAIIQIKDFMEESGYQMLIAHNGAEALEIIAQTIPDAMILDLMMPDIDGFEVLKTIREAELTAHIPVLILTAKHITKEELKFLKRNNVHQLIQKGDVNRNELLAAVSTMVNPEIKPIEKAQPILQVINGKPVVLVVEDNADNMITVKALLAEDYVVLEAVDGYSCIEMAKKHKPNLVLMDIALPGMDGIEAFKSIRKYPQLEHVPILALTASAMSLDRETILAHGFDAYIAKPIDEKIFFKTINQVLYGK